VISVPVRKYCPNCDEEYTVEEEERVCPDCGTPLEAVEEGEGEKEEEEGGEWE
jgi:Zn finger protein HypA/HybF involved in hydrogenase expression